MGGEGNTGIGSWIFNHYSQATLEVLRGQLLQEDPAHHVGLAGPEEERKKVDKK